MKNYRAVTRDTLTPERAALATEMVETYDGSDHLLQQYRRQLMERGRLTLLQLLRVLNEERATSRRMERITTEVTEPDMFGNYHVMETDKYAWQCLGCGLVWAIRWHADTCAERQHVTRWEQRYVSGPIVNGKPASERFYERRALRKDPLPEAAKSSTDAPTTTTRDFVTSHTSPPLVATVAHPLILSGTYTVAGVAEGHRTIKIEDADPEYWKNLEPGTRIASYLYGPDNETNFKGFAFVKPNGLAVIWKSHRDAKDLIAVLDWLLKHGPGREIELAKAYAVLSGRCGFCGRTLTTPRSVTHGYGPVCAKQRGLPWRNTPVATVKAAATVAAHPLRTYEELFPEDAHATA